MKKISIYFITIMFSSLNMLFFLSAGFSKISEASEQIRNQQFDNYQANKNEYFLPLDPIIIEKLDKIIIKNPNEITVEFSIIAYDNMDCIGYEIRYPNQVEAFGTATIDAKALPFNSKLIKIEAPFPLVISAWLGNAQNGSYERVILATKNKTKYDFQIDQPQLYLNNFVISNPWPKRNRVLVKLIGTENINQAILNFMPNEIKTMRLFDIFDLSTVISKELIQFEPDLPVIIINYSIGEENTVCFSTGQKSLESDYNEILSAALPQGSWPVDSPNPVSNDFACYSAIGNYKYHTGIDMTSSLYTPKAYDTPVKAAAYGTVFKIYRLNETNTHSMGNVVIIQHPNGKFSLYCHLESISSNIYQGKIVNQGEQIGTMGNSTNVQRDSTTNPHLHFEYKNVGALGNSSDSGPYWGYTPDIPDAYGYIDPRYLCCQNYSYSTISPVAIESTTSGLNVRSGPSTDYAVLTQINQSQQFVSYQISYVNSYKWYKIYLPNVNGPSSGWIRGDYLIEKPEITQIEVFNTDSMGLIIRDTPNGSALQRWDGTYNTCKTSHIWDGQRFVLAQQQSGWYAYYLPRNHYSSTCSYNPIGPQIGWSSSDYLRLISGQPVTISFSSSPSGLQVTVDGTNYTTPVNFQWTPGSQHSISTISPQGGPSGTRYVFSSWSDGGAQSHTITTPSTNTTYTANFTTQYSLTTSANPTNGGTVSPSGTSWYNSGQTISVQATPNTGYKFSSWSGDASGSTNPTSITMNAPKNIVANFSIISPLILSLSGQRLEGRAWIIKVEYANLNFTVSKSAPIDINRYVLLRKVANQPYMSIKEFSDSELKNNTWTFNDINLNRSVTYNYVVEARAANGSAIARSNELNLPSNRTVTTLGTSSKERTKR